MRAWFADGGHLTFRLDDLGDESLEGYSQTFGDGRFKMSAFKRIEFNIHDWRLDEFRGSSSREKETSPTGDRSEQPWEQRELFRR